MRAAPRRPSSAGAGPLGVAAAVLAALAAGCASVPARVPLPPEALAARAALEERWQAFGDLRGLASIDVHRGGRRDRLSGVLLLHGPRRGAPALRFEALSPFGPPVLVVGGQPDGVTVWEVVRNRAFLLPPSPDATRRWLGLALGVEDLVALLAGHVRAEPDPLSGRMLPADEHGPSLELVGREGVQRIWLDPASGRATRLEWTQGKRRLAARFDRGEGEGPPGGIALSEVDGGLDVQLRYGRVAVDTGFEAGLLAVNVPQGVEIQDFR